MAFRVKLLQNNIRTKSYEFAITEFVSLDWPGIEPKTSASTQMHYYVLSQLKDIIVQHNHSQS